MSKFRNFKYYIFILIIFIAGVSANAKSKSVKPIKNKKIAKVLIDNKQITYYLLSSTKSTLVSLDGPGELKILSRAIINEAKSSSSYEIEYNIDGSKKGTYKVTNKEADNKAIYVDNPIPELSKSSRHKMKLGSGYHTIELKLSKSSANTIVKMSFSPHKSKKHKWIEFQPANKCENVTLLVNESPIPYLRFTKANPIKITIIGPTDLKVLTRNENDYAMRGRVNYRISVKQDGKILNTYQISSDRSETAIYKDNDKLVPGKAKDFIIKVPKGKHQYEITPLDNDKSSLLGKILIPQKSAKLTE